MFEWLDNEDELKAYLPELTPEIKAVLLRQRALLAKNQATTGFTAIAEVLPTPQKKQARLLQSGFSNDNLLRERNRIQKQYALNQPPKLSAVRMILSIEKEGRLCEGCTGECRKQSYRYAKAGVQVFNGQWYENREKCVYGRQFELEREFKAAHLPERYAGKTLADYAVDSNNKVAVDGAKYLLNGGRGVYYYGACGVGKTFLAAIIAQEFLKAGKTVLFEKVPDLLRDIRATYDGEGNEGDKLQTLRGADVVILDDFGMEKPTQWAGAMMCKIIDLRYDRQGGTTIITSNLPLEALAQHLDNATDGATLNGTRIVDRCREICKPILLKGESRRT